MGVETVVSLEHIQNFFLEVSARTYAAGAGARADPALPGARILTYVRAGLRYRDCYFASAGRSLGETVIWVEDVPVWGMQYHGVWTAEDRRVIPFLKQALLDAYRRSLFFGGRGPERFTDGTLTYENQPVKNDFALFRGHEAIRDEGRLLFWHRYAGLALQAGEAW